jgi:protoporphyrin/coproporphyrin ferrochelatase
MKIAVVLFNLGGPDSPEAVQPFLRNLFSDPAIISLPTLLRLPLASFIARRRAAKARAIYAQIGGASPILGQTESQARALEEVLRSDPVNWYEWRAFVCMRYWHPMTDAVVQKVRRFEPDRILLLPLYPQFSTATTRSSIEAWRAASGRMNVSRRTVCCYPADNGFIEASVDLIQQAFKQTEGEQAASRKRRVLFSAHGLPEKIIKRGDPYQAQVELTASTIASRLGLADWSVCYQSRVGPLKWIGPSTEAEIERAGRDGAAVVLYPLSFVSEHSETLVELDIDYRGLAERSGVPSYTRVPTVGTHPSFIAGLASQARALLDAPAGAICHGGPEKPCRPEHGACPLTAGAV